MPPTLADRLVHILQSIDVIQQLLAGRTLDDFKNDLYLRLASSDHLKSSAKPRDEYPTISKQHSAISIGPESPRLATCYVMHITAWTLKIFGILPIRTCHPYAILPKR